MNTQRLDLPTLKSLLPNNKDVPEHLLVRNVVLDHRQIKAGDLYIARSGEDHKGVDFVISAINAGASAVVMHAEEYDSTLDRFADWIFPVKDLNQVAGEILNRYHHSPSESMNVIGITGTNGKTSCCHFIAQALYLLGEKAAIVGTIGNGFLPYLEPSTHTTPDVSSMHQLLANYKKAGAQSVVMEVSSHALDQGRTAGVTFSQVGLTNLTRDHLDYHKTITAYADSKRRLFDHTDAIQLINADDAFGRDLIIKAHQEKSAVLTYSCIDSAADIYVKTSELHEKGIRFALSTPWGEISASSSLIGRFNLSNLLLTAASLGASGFPNVDISRVLTLVKAVSGRMEKVSTAGEPLVLVDYAHTPDALLQTLSAISEHRKEGGRIFCVFGCGGDRDKGKRPVMSQVACGLADQLILTNDNPRSEDPQFIIDQILEGVRSDHSPIIELDRAKAIDMAITMANTMDIVLIAGKGHEDYQEVMGIRYPFSDQAVAKQRLSAQKNSNNRDSI